MSATRNYHVKHRVRQAKGRNTLVGSRFQKRQTASARRSTLTQRDLREPFAPPEDWHEPDGAETYRIVVQPPGPGYRHVVTPDDVRRRLAQVPERLVRGLEVIQFSRMTRKKSWFPCYGMQWGSALYLYPIEESMVEHFPRLPAPNFVNEVRMYGGRWQQDGGLGWRLVWSPEAARDFYLNNVLMHELGHFLDERNSSYADRERFAEWFAVEYGYRRTGGRQARTRKKIRRRHHAC